MFQKNILTFIIGIFAFSGGMLILDSEDAHASEANNENAPYEQASPQEVQAATQTPYGACMDSELAGLGIDTAATAVLAFLQNPSWDRAVTAGSDLARGAANGTAIGLAYTIWDAHQSCDHLDNGEIANAPA